MQNNIIKNNIVKNEFFNYIKGNYLLTECEKKSIIFYYNRKFKFFVENNSNKQIITFYKEAIDNNNIEEITRLQILFNHFMNFDLSNKIIDLLKTKKKVNDTDIINYILKNIDKKSDNKYNDKNIYKCDKWLYAIQHISLFAKYYLKSEKNIKYLDICCGNGKKTDIFQKSLNVGKDNTYCTDINVWGPYKNKSKIPFQFKLIVDDHLDYESNYFDIATCILSLHHISNLNKFIDEIYRIIKPGGFFILIEHSVITDYDRLFINIQHLLYTVLYDKKEDYIENADYIYCYSMNEWNYLMLKHNFILKKEEVLAFDSEFSFKYDNIFYGIYQKKDKIEK